MALSILILFLALVAGDFANASDLTDNERWVISQIRSGKVADLELHRPNDRNWAIRADFVVALLNNVFPDLEIARKGIHIRHGHIYGTLDLEATTCPHELALTECVFSGPVILSGAYFHRNISFVNSHFERDVSASRLNVGKSLAMDHAQFLGKVDLSRAHIGGDVRGRRMGFRDMSLALAVIDGTIYLQEVGRARETSRTPRAESDVQSLGSAGRLNLARARVAEAIDASKMTLVGAANFYGCTAADLILDDSEFRAEWNSRCADIRNNCSMEGVRFVAGDAEVRFDQMRVGGNWNCSKVKFAGRADFRSIDVGFDLDCSETCFEGTTPNVPANFNASRVGRSAYFGSAVFSGMADFEYARIGGALSFGNAIFLSSEFSPSVSSVHVGGPLVLSDTQLNRGITCMDSHISGDVIAQGARCNGRAVFQRTTIEGELGFTGVPGPASPLHMQLAKSELGSLSIAKAIFSRLDLSDATVRDDIRITDTEVQNLYAAGMDVKGKVALLDTILSEEVRLQHCSMRRLSVQRVKWPEKSESVFLAGMEYLFIGHEESITQWCEIKEMFTKSQFSADAYKRLEEFYAKSGMPGQAKEVYVAMRNREGDQAEGPERIGNWLIKHLVNYGRNPEWAFAWSAVPLLFGFLLFGYRRMEPRDGRAPDPVYNRLWYTCDSFLPFVDLQIARFWRPKAKESLARAYMRVHTLLVPFLLRSFDIC